MTTAFFPGKFQPPHTGHYMTISKLLEKYTKVIVGISEDEPEGGRVCTQDVIEEVFRTIFRSAGDRIEIIQYPGTLIEYDSLINLPKFDILITAGNLEVFLWGKQMNVEVKNISRSNIDGIVCNGTKMRETYEQNKPRTS